MDSSISSAVVLPEPSELQQPSSPIPRKRRQSSISSTTSTSKRPRFESSTQARDSRSPTVPASAPSNSDTSVPSHRRHSLIKTDTGLEERKRSRRLFGNILGTLSGQSTSNKTTSAGQQRRAEIEKKQLEKLKSRREEEEKRRTRWREELGFTRRREQWRWEEAGLRVRHEGMRAMARSLKTETKPILYWRPWEMRTEEQERIDRQIKEVEDEVEREEAEFEERRRKGLQELDHEERDKQKREEARLREGIDPGSSNGDTAMEVNGTHKPNETITTNGHANTNADHHDTPDTHDNIDVDTDMKDSIHSNPNPNPAPTPMLQPNHSSRSPSPESSKPPKPNLEINGNGSSNANANINIKCTDEDKANANDNEIDNTNHHQQDAKTTTTTDEHLNEELVEGQEDDVIY